MGFSVVMLINMPFHVAFLLASQQTKVIAAHTLSDGQPEFLTLSENPLGLYLGAGP